MYKEDIRVQGIQIWPLVGMFGEIRVAIPPYFYYAARHIGELKNTVWKLWLAVFIVAPIFSPHSLL